MRVKHPYKPVPWDCTVEVRPGLIVPTLGPGEAGDAPTLDMDAMGAELKRWPGLVVWVWRLVVGQPRRGLDGEIVRSGFRAITAKQHHVLLRRLSDAEVELVVNTYVATRRHHAALQQAQATAECRRQAPIEAAPAPAPSPGFSRETLTAAWGPPSPRKGKLDPGDTLRMPGGEEVRVPGGGKR